MEYKHVINDRGIRVKLMDEEIVVCECKISLFNNTWSISEWFTNSEYKNQGYGTKTMKYAVQMLVDQYGKPKSVRYNWNCVNEYVFEWLSRHFDPKPLIPEYERFTGEDTWDAHIYILDKDKFVNYFIEE